jgi:tetratricopeptide (TPR) repeat protein
MKPAVVPANVLPARPASLPPELAFPPRSSLPTLRALRQRHFRESRHDLALRVAMEVARRDPGRDSYFRLGFLYREVGRYREALKALRDALRFESGPKYLLPEIHLHIAFTWFLMGKTKRMGESLRRAYALRPKPRTACSFHLTYGAFLFSKKKYREAAAEYERAESTARLALARGRAATNQGMMFLREGSLEEAALPLDRAIRILKRSDHTAELALARAMRAIVYFEKGQFNRALGMHFRAARAYRSAGIPDREAEALVNAAYAAGELGLWPRARAFLDRTIRLASGTGQYSVLSPAYALRATVCAYNEDFEEAAVNLAQSKRLLKGRRDWVATLHFCRAQGRVASLLGHWNEVFRVARRAERLAAKVGDLPRVAEFRRMRAAAEEKLGRKRAATQARNAADKVKALFQGPSADMRQISKIAPKLAASDLPLLIVGESGSRLVSLAREIHRTSARAKRICVVIACEQLVFPASDLQGHSEGAWSGAAAASAGQVAAADEGTLVLDRVDLLSKKDQFILLRIVEGRLRPVGSAEERPIDLRLIATCACAESLIPELRHRLEGAVIRMPALEERQEEILKTIREHLAGRRRITPDALAELARHPWEGDLPQVRAIVDRLVMHSENLVGKKLVRAVLTPERRRVARRVPMERLSIQSASAGR